MATIGFVVLAVGAGFDPGKNLMKMFSYVFMVWMVTLFTTQITANIQVNDLVVNGDGIQETRVVEKVPALVVMPAALTSQVGYYFTRMMENYFSTPDSFKMASGSVGQFNLFAKMEQESQQYSIRFPELKKSISAYVSDCAVSAMARDVFFSPDGATGADGSVSPWRGPEALLRTSDILGTLASAKNVAIMTTYYPVKGAEYQSDISGQNFNAPMGGMGTVISCDAAYGLIHKDVEANAQALIDKGTKAWAKSGVMVPYEQTFRTMLSAAAANSSVDANFTSPNGYIMQQGFMNTMSGHFRQAAIETGNNEMLQAASLSLAEAQQRSSWVSSFEMFNNMTGYVFTVLQAFIFAITPLIVVSLLIPGLGKSIFANYAQILLWMTLWMPMLALVNFIITLFAIQDNNVFLSVEGGLSWANKGLMSERTNQLVIAAQFLGTMVPTLSWGIVKGAMAFTEFITHGIGSQFASSAGATAAAGNLSMNNMSMDNFSANKYNSASSSTVGTQSVNAFVGAGAMDVTHALGGQSTMQHGSKIESKDTLQQGLSSRISESHSTRDALSQAASHSTNHQEAMDWLRKQEHSAGNQRAMQIVSAMQKNATHSESAGTADSTTDASSTGSSAGDSRQVGHSTKAGVDGSIGVSSPFGGVKASASTDISASNSRSQGENASLTQSGSHSTSGSVSDSTSQSGSKTNSDSASLTNGSSKSESHGHSVSDSTSFQNQMSHAIATEEAYSKQLEHMKSVTSSMSVSNGVSAAGAASLLNQIDGVRSSMPSESEMNSRMSALSTGMAGSLPEQGHSSFSTGGGGGGALTGGSFGGGFNADPSGFMGKTGSTVSQGRSSTSGSVSNRSSSAHSGVGSREVSKSSMVAVASEAGGQVQGLIKHLPANGVMTPP
jgi:hypothetical protein